VIYACEEGGKNKGIGKVSRRVASRLSARSCYRNDALRRFAEPDKDAGKEDRKLKCLELYSTAWKSTVFGFSIFEFS
jgi:hypothetical protein